MSWGGDLDKSDRVSLNNIALHLKNLNQPTAAVDIYRPLATQLELYNYTLNALIQNQPQYNAIVYVPYAQWLAVNGKLGRNQKALHKIGKSDEAFKVFQPQNIEIVCIFCGSNNQPLMLSMRVNLTMPPTT
ncbi:hypothetical protein GWI33_004450 [Rhynchophorus ferrugineus]|uniref:Uncharacterized protein n=1 Tax=Rhynchophorus ferrugineus TaxID=354439 RepID=A0A834IKV2_RHYFE|nr:hypothetical protein GWI33_004450 [Rhynchophorus ferrugineus]